MEDKIIQILVQGGLASVALVSVYLNYKLVSNHFSHSDDVLRDLTKVLVELKEIMKSHIKVNKEDF